MAESDLQKLIRMANPGMARADQFVRNTVKMRGLGPDDPIEWGAFSTEPEPQAPKRSPLFELLGMLAPSAQAGTGQMPSDMDDLVTRLLMMGYDPEKEGVRVTR